MKVIAEKRKAIGWCIFRKVPKRVNEGRSV